MSDLQCPATFLLVGEDAAEAGLPGERVAASYDGVESAGQLQDLADLHRGETVLVRGPLSRWRELATDRSADQGIDRSADQGADRRKAADGYRLEIDADGWRLSPLPSRPPSADPRPR